MRYGKNCPSCGRGCSGRFAMLPNGGGVVCERCFKKKTGHTPLPAGSGMMTSLGYHQGQYIKNPDMLNPVGPRSTGVTIKGVTLRGATLGGLTIRGATVRGATVRGATLRGAK